MRQITAVATNKGGVLKTSMTVNLAGVLAKKGYKVLIIDTDNQGNALLSFGMNPDSLEKCLYHVLLEGENPKDIIVSPYKRIDILPSNDDMTFFEFDVLTNISKYNRPFHLLRDSIEPIKHKYDYILIDTPPNLGLVVGNVLTLADDVLIPFQPETYSMRSLVKILNAINNFRLDHNPNLDVLGIVATLVDLRTTLHSEVLQEAKKFCLQNNVKMYDTVIPRTIRFASSVAYKGLPATLATKNNELVSAYYELMGELLNE